MSARGKPRRDLSPILDVAEWTSDELNMMREKMSVSRSEVGDCCSMNESTVLGMDSDNSRSHFCLRSMYGLLLEHYYASIHGYTPCYRRLGTNDYISPCQMRAKMRGELIK